MSLYPYFFFYICTNVIYSFYTHKFGEFVYIFPVCSITPLSSLFVTCSSYFISYPRIVVLVNICYITSLFFAASPCYISTCFSFLLDNKLKKKGNFIINNLCDVVFNAPSVLSLGLILILSYAAVHRMYLNIFFAP